MANIRPGDINQAVAFDLVTEIPDGNNGFDLVKETINTRAHFRFLRGGETVQAARLDGKQPLVATIRRNERTRQITTDTVMRDTRTGTRYNIKAIVPTDDRKFLEVTAQSEASA